jgi:ribose 5-phosphate isomerase RpiB
VITIVIVKMVMLIVMGYLTQLTGVLITLIHDASKKIQQHNNSNLLLMGVGIRQDREIERRRI